MKQEIIVHVKQSATEQDVITAIVIVILMGVIGGVTPLVMCKDNKELFRTFKSPVNVFWEVTPLCNHNCVHCFNYWRTSSEETYQINEQSEDVNYLLLTEKIIEVNPAKVVITGGEPLLVWDKIRPCIDLLHSKGIYVSMNTNATLITPEIAQYLKKEKISLFVSFPCHEAAMCDLITNTKNSRDNILKGLDILQENQCSYVCNMVISNENIGYAEDTVLFLKERYGIKRVNLSRVGKPVNATADFDKWLLDTAGIRQLIELSVCIRKKYGVEVDASSPYPACILETQEEYDIYGGKRACSAGKSSCVVGSDGSVKACPRDSKVYGNLLDTPFEIIWAEMDEWRREAFYPEECRKCNFFVNCLGGCRADQLANVGHCRGLDSAVRLEKIPLAFEKNKCNHLDAIHMDDVFVVPEDVRWDKENDGYRMLLFGRCVYVKQEAYDFLSNTPRFTLSELMQHFKFKEDVAKKVVQALLDNQLLRIVHS